MTPGLASCQVRDDDTVATFDGAVCDVRIPSSMHEIEADIVKVRIGICDSSGEHDSLEDIARRNINANEFRAAEGSWDEGTVRCEGAAGVEDPSAVLGIGYDGLGADDVLLIVRAGWWCSCVVYSSSWWVIHLRARPWALGVVADKFGNGVFAIGAVVCVIAVEAWWVIGELASFARDCDACRELIVVEMLKFHLRSVFHSILPDLSILDPVRLELSNSYRAEASERDQRARYHIATSDLVNMRKQETIDERRPVLPKS